jgi:hypothetical protein
MPDMAFIALMPGSRMAEVMCDLHPQADEKGHQGLIHINGITYMRISSCKMNV